MAILRDVTCRVERDDPACKSKKENHKEREPPQKEGAGQKCTDDFHEYLFGQNIIEFQQGLECIGCWLYAGYRLARVLNTPKTGGVALQFLVGKTDIRFAACPAAPRW